MSQLTDSIAKIKALAKVPLVDDKEVKRVEIIILKFKEPPEVIDKCITRIIHNTDWPFKLTIFDNRPNNANTSRIWNKLIREATCRYILIMDSDAFIPATKTEPCWLTRMMESIDETGFVIPVSSAPGGQDQHVSGPLPYPSATINKGIWSGYCFLFDREGEWRERIVYSHNDHLNLFDERFYIYGQDSEFAYRVSKIGGAVMRQDVFVEHIGGFSFKQDPVRDDDKIYARELFKYLTKQK
jgi:hypothetical protein